jgi:redox-sensitive bicupin YhaK (pirin superfamily)
MITLRKSEERHHTESKDRKTWMTFDLANKADPLKDGFSTLEILNEEILSPESGFTLPTRKDMIVVTYVREGMMIHIGPLAKPDSMIASDFQWAKISPDKKQYAFNTSESEDAHIFQCGFSPCEGELKSDGGIKMLFTHAQRQGVLKLIASSDGRESSLTIQQDIEIYSTLLNKGNHIIHEIAPGRTTWLHVVNGHALMNDLHVHTGDGAGFSEEKVASFTAQMPTEILVFDLCGLLPEKIKAGLKATPQTVKIP